MAALAAPAKPRSERASRVDYNILNGGKPKPLGKAGGSPTVQNVVNKAGGLPRVPRADAAAKIAKAEEAAAPARPRSQRVAAKAPVNYRALAGG